MDRDRVQSLRRRNARRRGKAREAGTVRTAARVSAVLGRTGLCAVGVRSNAPGLERMVRSGADENATPERKMRASGMREPSSDLRRSKARVAGAHLQAVLAANTPVTDALRR